ncbi:U3 snoRNP protein [Coemansia sp. Benny D115]|nr:U3 snoRNP protein [Coemansia sp. Benny D115]
MAAAKRKNTAAVSAPQTRDAESTQAQIKRRIAMAAEDFSEDDGSMDSSSEEEEEDDDDDQNDMDVDSADREPMLAGENTGQKSSARSSDGKKKGGAQPTNAEIMALNEAALLFKSNLFKLQVDELLTESLVLPGTKDTRGLDAVLRQVREVIMSLAPVAEMSVDAAKNMVRKAGREIGDQQATVIPFPDPAPPAGMQIKLGFQPPETVAMVGSYSLGMTVRSRAGVTVDLMAQMPKALFADRDHLNYRYFYKRAFYVTMLHHGLHSSALSETFDVAVESMRGDLRLPVVVLRSKRGSGVRALGRCPWTIRVLPGIASDTFNLKRLSADRNSIRPSFVMEGASDEGDLPATPQYNAALASDALMVSHTAFMYATTEMCPEFPRAAALLRVWYAQRRTAGLRLGAFALTLVLAWLVRQGRLGATLSAHALFRGAIEFIALHDFEVQPVEFGSADSAKPTGEGAVLGDPTATANVLAGVPAWELAELRRMAYATARDVNCNGGSERFSRIFLRPDNDPLQRFDHTLRLEATLAPFLAPRTGNIPVARRLVELDCGHPVYAVQKRLAALLGSALAEQAAIVAVQVAADADIQSAAHMHRRHIFTIGLVASGDAAQRVVGLGPSPDEDEQAAARFRALWGGRCELRRFRDGTIRLATVWDSPDATPEHRVQVLPRMAAFLLRRHFGADVPVALLSSADAELADQSPPAAAKAFANQGSMVMSLGARLEEFLRTVDGSEAAAYEPALAAFEELRNELGALENQLPLRILALHASAPGLRYTSMVPPKPLPVDADDAYIEPMRVAVEFAASMRWPDDAMALYKVKSAFLLRIAECYETAHPESAVSVSDSLYGVVSSDGVLPKADDCYLDIRHASSGQTFRLTILCDREGEMLEKRVRNLRLAPAATMGAQVAAVENAHKQWLRDNVWRPRHHRLMLSLCQRNHPALSLSIRLLKRWLSRHLLLGPHSVPEEVAELAAAFAFTSTGPAGQAPGSAIAGFTRTLHLLAEWRWKDDLCVVDFTAPVAETDGVKRLNPETVGVWSQFQKDAMPSEVLTNLQQVFESARDSGRITGGLRIATEDDPEAKWWDSVSPLITRRLATLAKASLACLDNCLLTGSIEHMPEIFSTPMADYDFIVKLDRDVVCRRYQQPPASVFATSEDGPEDMDTGNDEKEEVFKNLVFKASATRVKGVGSRHANPFSQPGMIGFDPVALFVQDLRSVYSDSVLFFNDVYGGSSIACLWNPKAVSEPMMFATSAQVNVRPMTDKETSQHNSSDGKKNKRTMVKYNTHAVIEEIARLGEGLVEDVVIQRDI